MSQKELLTLKEAAALCGVSRWTFHRWVNARAIEQVVIGQSKRYRRDDVIALCKGTKLPDFGGW